MIFSLTLQIPNLPPELSAYAKVLLIISHQAVKPGFQKLNFFQIRHRCSSCLFSFFYSLSSILLSFSESCFLFFFCLLFAFFFLIFIPFTLFFCPSLQALSLFSFTFLSRHFSSFLLPFSPGTFLLFLSLLFLFSFISFPLSLSLLFFYLFPLNFFS